ncbi:hypothetical protein N9I82_01640 [Alphaproteobacteria bacterium]|nr:hypothetical protein [Alphaproteobacteria bacterium]
MAFKTYYGILLSLVLLMGCQTTSGPDSPNVISSGKTSRTGNATSTKSLPENVGQLVIYRDGALALLRSPDLYVDAQPYGICRYGAYTTINMRPGTYRLNVGTESVDVEIKDGEQTFAKCGVWRSILDSNNFGFVDVIKREVASDEVSSLSLFMKYNNLKGVKTFTSTASEGVSNSQNNSEGVSNSQNNTENTDVSGLTLTSQKVKAVDSNVEISPEDPLAFFVHPETLSFCNNKFGDNCHRNHSKKYWGKVGRFTSKLPVSVTNFENIYEVQMANGDLAYYGNSKSYPFPLSPEAEGMWALMPLSQHVSVLENKGRYLDVSQKVRIVEIEYVRLLGPTYKFLFSNGMEVFNDEFENLVNVTSLLQPELQTEFLNNFNLFRRSKDDFENRFILSAADYEAPLEVDVFLNGDGISGRVEIAYHSKSWLFVETVKINADGETFELNELIGKKFKRDSGTSIREWAYIELNEDAVSKLKKIINSKRTQIRFYGKDYYNDREVTADTKAQIRISLAMLGLL